MNYTEEAIKRAIEGGWIAKCCVDPLNNYHWYKSDIFLDPSFWQGLGKRERWKEGVFIGGQQQVKGSGGWCKWHDLIDHLAEGKDAESFFKSLLEKR